MWRGQQDSMFYYLQQSINMIGEGNKTQLYSLNMKLAFIVNRLLKKITIKQYYMQGKH